MPRLSPSRVSVALAAGLLILGCTKGTPDASATKPPVDYPNDAAAWRVRRYADENGAIPERAWQTALEERARVVAASELLPAAGGIARGAWVSRGPSNVAGRSRAIVIDPRNPQRLLMGSVSGGLWRSTDAGATWAIVDDWWANLSVPCVTMDPANPDVLYVGTGEGFYSLAHLVRSFSHFVRGAGVLKSTDGGQTWTQLPGTATWQHTTRIAVSPANSNLLLASRRPGGIARSTDGGQTWTDVATGDSSFQVLFDPNDPTKAVAHLAPTPLVHGVITSVDSGATWQPAVTGLATVNGENSRIELCYARSVPGMVYASTGLNGGRVWRSTDGGRNWVLRSGGTSATSAGYYYNGLWVDPTNENVVVVGALNVWRSTDGGTTLTSISNGYIMTTDPHSDVHSFTADPGYNGTTNRRVYATTDGGLHVADDILAAGRGTGWRDLDTTQRSSQFYGAAGHGTNDVVVGGTQDNGTLRMVGASTTANLVYGGDGGQVQIDPTNPSYTYGETQYLGVHRSSNGGQSATSITSGLSDASSTGSNFISPLRLDPNDPLRLYAGGARLWRTTNARGSPVGWTIVKADAGSLIASIAITPGASDRVYVGHNDGRLYRTTNATAASPTWITIDDNGAANPLPNRVPTRLVVDPTNPNVVYVTFGGFAADNVWRSGDAGVSWQRVTGAAPLALPSAPVYGIAVHPDDGNVLYAATEVGVFASDDAGAHWTTSNDGPANVVAEEITFMHGTRRLVLATLGRGIWTADVARPRAAAFGTACTAQAQPPRLGVDPLAPARVGRSTNLLGSDLRAGQPAATLLLGLSDQTWGGVGLPLALDFAGLPTCRLLVSVDVLVPAPISAGGMASWTVPIPEDRNLLGRTFFTQILSPDPGVNAAGLVISAGLAVTIGW